MLIEEEARRVQLRTGILTLVALGAALLMAPSIVPADEPVDDTRRPATPTSESRSGYEDVPQFGGPSSVGAQLQEDDAAKTPWLRLEGVDRALEPWFAWKSGLTEKHGLSFGLNYSTVAQGVTESAGDDFAAGGIFQALVSWTVTGRESGNTGTIVFKGEHRHAYTGAAPQDFGFEAGALAITATQFSDFGLGVTNLYWQQRFNDGRLSFVAGKVDPTDYLDVYGLINPQTSFMNLSFSTNPTIAAPNQGLGAALGAMLSDQIYTVVGVSDANGDPKKAGFDTFFDDAEYFSHVELGWTPSQDRIYLDNAHLTLWHVAERKAAGVADGWGGAFSYSRFINDRWAPFLRAGWSDGEAPLLNGSLSAGLGRYFTTRRDLLGLGLSWGDPAAGDLDDQYTAEAYYRFQLTQNVAVTPDLQLVIHPALNPDQNALLFFGIRARAAF